MRHKKNHTSIYRSSIGTFTGFVVLSLILILQGCGFQLDRNKLQLPNEAKSISIARIENRSYVPRLDIKLKTFLIERFNADSIPVKSVRQADLVLNFIISSFSMKRDEYALDNSGQTYEFLFAVSGNLTIFDNRNKSFYLNNFTITNTYSIITEDTDLSTIEIDEGRIEVLNILSQAIADKITDNF